MDISVEQNIVKTCFKCQHLLYDNLNIAYNEITSMVILWNKFQIFVYEDINFSNSAKVFVPEFQIHQLLISHNYMLCLDTSSNVHTISLKFKNPAQKRFKCNFQPREQNIFVSQLIQDNTISLKYKFDKYFLCFHKINTEYQLEAEVMLTYSSHWSLPKPIIGKCLLHSRQISEKDFEHIKDVYNVNHTMSKDWTIILISFDKLTVYSCFISTKPTQENITLVKLHTCPAEICDLEVDNELTVIIGLTIGTIMRFNLKDTKKPHKIVHLNNAVYKYLLTKDLLIYTDGFTMWRTDKTFHNDITFRQFKVKHAKDFVKCRNQLICTTYTNLIYVLTIDDDISYVKSTMDNEYCSAEKLLNNSEVLFKILKEIDINNDIVKKIKEETNCITALSLSNRQDIMDTVIQKNVIVYETYDEVRKDHANLILTDDKTEYFESNTFLILIQLTTTTLNHVLNDMLSKLLDNLVVHITLVSNRKIIKTASKNLREVLKKLNILITVNNKNNDILEMDVYTKIVVSMPGSHDRKQTLWTCLYRKHVRLHSEHFIKTNHERIDICMKDSHDTIENLVCKVAQSHHKHLFKFIDTTKQKGNTLNWSLYLKLPVNYRDLLNNCNTQDIFNSRKAQYLLQQYTLKEFLDSKTDIQFDVGCDKVNIKVIDDFSRQLLKLTSDKICIAFNIRSFFSTLIYNDFNKYGASKEYVKYTLYNIVENLQKELRDCIMEPYTLEAFRSLAEQFERNVIGALPI